MNFFLVWLRGYLTIRKAWMIIREDGSKYRLLKCEVVLRKGLRDEALDRWSRCGDDVSCMLYVELEGRRLEYFQAVSDLWAWRLSYKKSWGS